MVMNHRGFNDAVNGFLDDGWSILASDGVEDVTIAINSNPGKFVGSQYNNTLTMLPTFGGVLCAKASMLLQVLSNDQICILYQIVVLHYIIPKETFIDIANCLCGCAGCTPSFACSFLKGAPI